MLYFFCFLLSVEVIILSVKNQELMSAIENIENIVSGKNISSDANLYSGSVEMSELSTGMNISALEFQKYNRNTIVFYFSATCSLCDEAAAYWNVIYAKYCENFNIFGLSRDNKEDIRKYIIRNNVQFPIYVINKLDNGLESIMSKAPMTLIFNKEGLIIRIYEGIIYKLDNILGDKNK